MPTNRNAVLSPPSAVRVALIWLTLSIASMAGFASARPHALESPAPDAIGQESALGAEAGALAAMSVSRRSRFVPARSERWRELVAAHFAPQDVPLALRVIHCESSGWPDAVNDAYGASGLFQHLPSFWDERTARANVSGSIFDPETNVAVAAWLVYEGGGWRHWNESRPCWSDGSPLQ